MRFALQRFDGAALDRHEGRREDESFLGSAWQAARILVIDHGRVPVEGSPPRLRWTVPPHLPSSARAAAVLLGSRDDVAYWAVEAAETGGFADLGIADDALLDLRSAGLLLSAFEAGVVAHAAALLAWHRRSRYCGACGAPTVGELVGERRRCRGDDCGELAFPRTDPAIITLVTRDDECLLVHQPGWKPGMFATIAGFVGPGEGLESAVAREVREEVGLEIVAARYFASQPWPFPTSLMVGFLAEAAVGSRVELSAEVAAARWLSRPAIAAALRDGEIGLAPGLSISFSLVAHWYGDRDELTALARASPIQL